jgi:hypothetical protein
MNAAPGIDQPPPESVPEASRRTFLKGVGLAGAAGLAGPLLTSTGALAATGTLIYGINNDNYPAFTADNPKGFQYSYRAYDDMVWEKPQDVPTAWITAHPTSFVNWSVRPDLDMLLDGKFDDQIKSLLATAPDHSELTMWHEAAAPPHCGPGNKYAQHKWMTRKNLLDGHAYLHKLCTENPNHNGHHVDYGQIFIGPANQANVGGWIAPSLYWYGIDIYDNGVYWTNPKDPKSTLKESAIDNRMTSNKKVLNGKAKGYKLHITETNSPHPQHRKNWALYLSKWMRNNGGFRFQWFYHCGGSLSGCYSGLEKSTRTYFAKTIIPTYGKQA